MFMLLCQTKKWKRDLIVVVSVVVCEVVGVVQEEVALQEVEDLVMVCEEGMLFFVFFVLGLFIV
jgi:hypothetical protein